MLHTHTPWKIQPMPLANPPSNQPTSFLRSHGFFTANISIYLHYSIEKNIVFPWIFHGFSHQKHRHFPRHHLLRPGQPELDLHRPQTRARDRGPSRPGRLGASGGAGSGDAGGGRSELHLIAIADWFWFCSYVFVWFWCFHDLMWFLGQS